MKRTIACFLILALMMFGPVALAEGVVILESPDEPAAAEATGTLDDIRVGENIDLGDRIYMPTDAGIYQDSGDTDLVALSMTVLNLATKEIDCFNSAKVVVVYEGERGTYKFGGRVKQMIGDSYISDWPSIPVLKQRYYRFLCDIPDYVRENPGEIRMEIENGAELMTCIIRK